MAILSVRSLLWAFALFNAQPTTAIQSGDADALFTSWNNALLIRSGGDVYYRAALNDNSFDGTWTESLDILVAEDAYERTGDPNLRGLVYDLLNTWLRKVPPPWTWDWWNDDIGWFTLALIRGHLITGYVDFLTNAKYGFDLAYSRGWNTQYNEGGIWEQNPEGNPKELLKEALANDSLGKVACLIYQATHDEAYLSKCLQIFSWVQSHIYDAGTGQIYRGIRPDNTLDTASAAYNQGTFLDFAAIVYECTGDVSVKAIAQKAIDYAKDHLTSNGIFSNPDPNLNTWADEVARGAGRFVHNHQLWDKYYPWFVQNADAIMKNRRSDIGLTANAWDQATAVDNSYVANKFASAVSWLQYTPATMPSEIGGLHYIVNQKTGLLIDNGNTGATEGATVMQWGYNGNQNQRWQFSQNSDGTWNILSMTSFKAIDCPNGKTDDNLAMVQWSRNRDQNQRWVMEKQTDGSYLIQNAASGKYLDGASNSTNGASLIQWSKNGQSQQRWVLQTF